MEGTPDGLVVMSVFGILTTPGVSIDPLPRAMKMPLPSTAMPVAKPSEIVVVTAFSNSLPAGTLPASTIGFGLGFGLVDVGPLPTAEAGPHAGAELVFEGHPTDATTPIALPSLVR